jgi:hypothetical protein
MKGLGRVFIVLGWALLAYVVIAFLWEAFSGDGLAHPVRAVVVLAVAICVCVGLIGGGTRLRDRIRSESNSA